jgi:hypothetical protein
VRCGIPISKSLHALYYYCNIRLQSIRVIVVVTQSAAHPDQMGVQIIFAETSPTAYQRSVDLPQAFKCAPLDFVLSLP